MFQVGTICKIKVQHTNNSVRFNLSKYVFVEKQVSIYEQEATHSHTTD